MTVTHLIGSKMDNLSADRIDKQTAMQILRAAQREMEAEFQRSVAINQRVYEDSLAEHSANCERRIAKAKEVYLRAERDCAKVYRNVFGSVFAGSFLVGLIVGLVTMYVVIWSSAW